MSEENLFFVLMKIGLWGGLVREKYKFESIDWGRVFRLAEDQSVIGLVASGIDRLKANDSQFTITKEWALQFIGATLQLEQQNEAMNKFIASLVEEMRKKGIYALLVKGQGVAQCYEKPLWRSCGDVDLFLSEGNYNKAKELLVPQATEVEQEVVVAKHLGMTIDGWAVELHGMLKTSLSSRVQKQLNEIQKETFYGGQVRSWMDGRTLVFLLKEENEVLYVFVHFLNHFYKGGVGLRQICDWCRLLWTYRESLNQNNLESRIKQMGLMTEWKAFGALAVDYLGMPSEAMPFYDNSAKWNKKANCIISFIIKSGNFGHNRDLSYMRYPYVVRKFFSAGRRIHDLINHSRIFPIDSLRFSYSIMMNGVKSAIRREG